MHAKWRYYHHSEARTQLVGRGTRHTFVTSEAGATEKRLADLRKNLMRRVEFSDAPHIHAPVCVGPGKNSDVFLSTPRFQRRSRSMSIPKHMTARQNFSVRPRHPFSAAAAIWLLSSSISGKKLPVVDKTRRDNEYEQSINTSIETCLKRTL